MLPSHLVAKDPPADLVFTPLGAEPRPLSEWLTTFHLATVALDPYTNESAWILPMSPSIGSPGIRRGIIQSMVTANQKVSRYSRLFRAR